MNSKLPNRIDNGFTLVEVLIASFLTGLLILIAGYGLTIIINKNEQAEGESSRRIELNRAIEYMAEDIRAAQSISLANSYTISPPSPTCAIATPVLRLVISEGSTTKTVVYYFNDVSTPPSCGTSPVWQQPGWIKRVENPVSTTIAGYPDGSELVDAISAQIVTPTPTCPSGWTISPPTNQKGFYACLDNATNARAVELHLIGRVSNSPVKVETVKRQVFARSKP